jgi:uncharacterized protein (TIGR02145 family)
LGGESVAGGKMKSTCTIEAGTSLWYAPNTSATNESGFSCLPGGCRLVDGSFVFVGENGNLWSATESNAGILAWSRYLNSISSDVSRDQNREIGGFSVRCLRD